MAVFRVEKSRGYTVMSNHHLRNKELSLKAVSYTHLDVYKRQVLDVGATEGTAQTLLHAQQWAKGTFLAVYGDVLLSGEDVRRLAQCEAPWAALVSPLDGDRTGDHICARVQDGQIVRIVGHPREGDCRRLAAFRLDESVFPLLACCPSFFPDVEVGMMPPREKHLESVLLQDVYKRQPSS